MNTKTFSSIHGAALLGLTICYGLALGAGCVTAPEDTVGATDVADVGSENDDSLAEGLTDAGDDDVGEAQQAFAITKVPLGTTWIQGGAGSRWKKWKISAWRNTLGHRGSDISGYTCTFGQSCTAGINATVHQERSVHRTVLTVGLFNTVQYRNGVLESGTLSPTGQEFVRHFFVAMDQHRIRTVGRGRRLSERTDCASSITHAAAVTVGVFGACGAAIIGIPLEGIMGPLVVGTTCAAAALEATSASLGTVTPCGG
jgi:hypothetical protein